MEQYNPCIDCCRPILCKHCRLTHTTQAVQDRIAERDTLKAENARLREALEKIAEQHILHSDTSYTLNTVQDIASEALKGGK